MRYVFHILVGAIAGLAGGILAPIGLAYLMYLLSPEDMRQGGGTPFAIMLPLTATAGAIVGAIWGASRAFPEQEVVVRDSPFGAVDVEWRLSHVPEAERETAVVRLMHVWIEGFQSELRKHFVLLAGAALAIALTGWFGVLFILLPLAGRAARFLFKSRSAMRDFRRRYGEEAIRRVGELPRLLR